MSRDYRTYAIRKRQLCHTCGRHIEAGQLAHVEIDGTGRDTWRTYRHAGPCPVGKVEPLGLSREDIEDAARGQYEAAKAAGDL